MWATSKRIYIYFSIFVGALGTPIALMYFCVSTAKLGILAKCLPEQVAVMLYQVLTKFMDILPYLAGLLGIFLFILAIFALKDFFKERQDKDKMK